MKIQLFTVLNKKTGEKKIITYNESQLMRYALNNLSKREYGRIELFKKMARFQTDHSIIDKVLDKLIDMNYLSDERRAKSIINTYSYREGVNKLKQRMKTADLPEHIILDTIQEYLDSNNNENSDESDKSLELLINRYKNFDSENWQKMTRFLVSRGFDFDTIRHTLERFKKNDY